MQIYYTVTAEDYPEAAAAGSAPSAGSAVPSGRSFASYRIGAGSVLLRGNLPLQTRGGLLCASDREGAEIADPGALCAAFLRECGRRGYRGAVLDFERPPTPDRRAFAAALAPRMRETGRILYVPAAYAEGIPEAVSLLNTAVSGGNYQEYVEEEIRRRGGGDRVALDVQRLRMDFRLPAPSGEGETLDAASLDALREGKSVFFSPDLCARYFTCTKDGAAHFVLFDDAGTLNRKLHIGASLGIQTAFLLWQETADLAGQIRVTAPASTPASGG